VYVVSGLVSGATHSVADVVTPDHSYQAFDGRTNQVIGEFATLEEARVTLDEWDDIEIYRVEDGESPELVWEQ
jgi:hypothetical protein